MSEKNSHKEFINSTFLITGGAGFIGSSLIKRLLTLGCNKVLSLDDYSSGSTTNHHKGATYINGSTKNFESLITDKIDYIFHFGEYSRVEQSYQKIGKTIDSNLSGTSEIIKYWLTNKCKLIYSGSSTKFISGNSINELSPYSITKKNNTHKIDELGKLLEKDFAIVYFYNVYGENENSTADHGTVISKFMKLKEAGKPITVVKPGTQMRNFTHIDDTIDGILLVAEKGNGDNYGIGAAESYSIMELAQMFQSKITLLPERLGNRSTAELKTEKLKALGWQQKNTLEDYISRKLTLMNDNAI